MCGRCIHWTLHTIPLSDPTYVCRRHLCEYHQQTLNKELHLQHFQPQGQRPDGNSQHRSAEGGGYDTSSGTGTGPPGESHIPPPPPPPHTTQQSGKVSQPTHKPQSLPSTIQNTRNQLVLFDMESNTTVDPAHPRAAELWWLWRYCLVTFPKYYLPWVDWVCEYRVMQSMSTNCLPPMYYNSYLYAWCIWVHDISSRTQYGKRVSVENNGNSY